MNALLFPQEIVAMGDRLGEQAPHVRPPYADAEYDVRHSVSTQKIDFRLSRPGDVEMGRFVVERIDDEPEAVRAMDDNHAAM
jgi:hypothetical protein